MSDSLRSRNPGLHSETQQTIERIDEVRREAVCRIALEAVCYCGNGVDGV